MYISGAEVNTRPKPSSRRYYYYYWIAAGIIALHLLESATLGTAPVGSALAEGLESLAAGLAAVLCFRAWRRSIGMSRLFWLLFGIGVGSQCISDLTYAYYEAWVRLSPTTIPVVPAVLVFRVAVFAMVLSLDPEKNSSHLDLETAVDFLQIVIIFSFTYLYLNYIPRHYGPSDGDFKKLALVVLAQRGGLVLWAGLRVLYSKKRFRYLYAGLLLYLSWYLFVEGAALYFTATREIRSGSPLDLVWTVPCLAVAVWAAKWKAAGSPVPGELESKDPTNLMLSNASLSSAPLIVFLQFIYLGPHLPLIRYSLLGASILCFAVRVAIGEYRQGKQFEGWRLNKLALESSKTELAFQKAFLDQLIENAPEAIMLVDMNNSILRINRQFTNLFGYAPEEAVGNDFRQLIVPQHKIAESASLDREARERRVAGRETIRLNKQRIPIDVAVLVSSVEMREGQAGAIYCTYRDMREHKKMEERLRESQKMEALGRLAGGVAHDFNNLLGVMTGFSDLLSNSLPSNAKVLRRLASIKKAGQRGAELTRQLLAFSRTQVLSPSELDLNELVSEAEKMLPPLLGEDIELKVVFGSELRTVVADSGQILQVLLNLAMNARDAMPRGGVLTIKTANVEPEKVPGPREPVLSKSYVAFSVSDTGVGMDSGTQARIFEPFFTTKAIGDGTGLGLATVYGIVKQSNGYIFVESEPGQGTRFDVYLPCVSQAAQGLVTEPSQEAVAQLRGTETILVVEDEALLCDVVSETLIESGYHVLTATNGQEALAIAQKYQGPIHAVITDVVMPKMSGPEMAKQLTAVRPEAKILYISGYTNSPRGAFHFLDTEATIVEKPFEIVTLTRKLREVLNGNSAKSQGESLRDKQRNIADEPQSESLGY